MCNKVHRKFFKSFDVDPEFKDIPKSGEGWKVFRVDSDGKLLPLFAPPVNYDTDADGFAVWGEQFVQKDYGFCFFLDRKSATSLRDKLKGIGHYNSAVVVKIRYRKGLGSFITSEVFGEPARFEICQEFAVEGPHKL